MSNTSTKADNRPVDPRTGKPVGPLAQPGYYPGFSTLSQQKFWDAKTREVVLDRVQNVPPIRFFRPEQARLLTAICDRMLPQDDRDLAHRIPIVPQIDKRLFENTHDGYRFASMPPDRQAYEWGLQAIDQMAQHAHHTGFVDLEPLQQDEILGSLHDGKPSGANEIWERMPVHQFWLLLLTDCADAYYSHPWAWDEIGFGGPAYPRAYMRLERGEPEPWEVNEKRYEWRAPDNSLSGKLDPVTDPEKHHGAPSQGGTH